MDNLRHPDPDLVYIDGEPVKPVNTRMYFRFNDISTKNLLDDKFRDEFYKKCKAEANSTDEMKYEFRII